VGTSAAEHGTTRTAWGARPLRSFLFAPGSDERKLSRLGDFGADALVLDLEDAVALSEKASARHLVKRMLGSYARGPAVLVRVNGVQTGFLEEDLTTVFDDRLDGIIVPKVEDPDELALIDERLEALEWERGAAIKGLAMFPLVETAEGVMRVEQIAARAPERVVTLMFGTGDFSADAGVDLSASAEELLYARSRMVVSSRACELGAPVDGPYLLDLEDLDGLLADSRRSRGLGFRGRVVVHPSQVEPAQRAYSELSAEELARAVRIVEEFESAEAAGCAALRVDGRFIDYPPYERAKERIRLYEQTHGPAGPS
jgi:citrate lyase subunit beta/citryl-CoA lyase